MFEIGGTELLLVAIVALLVIGPKDLPNALRTLGRYTGKARAMTRHLRAGFDEMMRQAEMEEMEKQWAEHNRRIMAETATAEAPVAQATAAETPAAETPAAETPAAQPAADIPPAERPLP